MLAGVKISVSEYSVALELMDYPNAFRAFLTWGSGDSGGTTRAVRGQ